MARPSPEPPWSLARAWSSRVNRSKTVSWCSGGMPGPSSATSSTACAVAGRQAHRDGAGRVAYGVVDEVGDQASQLVAGAAHENVGGEVQVDADVGPRAGLRGLLGHHLPEVDLLVAQRLPRVEPGQQEEVGGERLDPLHIGQRLGRPPVSSRRVRRIGQRAPQLVRGVGDEPFVLLDGRLQPVERGVHRTGEGGDLVAGVGFGNPLVQVVRRDVGHLGADRRHRLQRAADGDPGEQGDEQQQRRYARNEQVPQRRYRRAASASRDDRVWTTMVLPSVATFCFATTYASPDFQIGPAVDVPQYLDVVRRHRRPPAPAPRWPPWSPRPWPARPPPRGRCSSGCPAEPGAGRPRPAPSATATASTAASVARSRTPPGRAITPPAGSRHRGR